MIGKFNRQTKGVRMILRFIFLLITFTFTISAYANPTPRMTLTPKAITHPVPFFESKTPVWRYNDQIPGPTIRAKEGSTILVDVLNQLDEPTSVHWHGLRIDNAMDGVPGVRITPFDDSFIFYQTFAIDSHACSYRGYKRDPVWVPSTHP